MFSSKLMISKASVSQLHRQMAEVLCSMQSAGQAGEGHGVYVQMSNVPDGSSNISELSTVVSGSGQWANSGPAQQ